MSSHWRNLRSSSGLAECQQHPNCGGRDGSGRLQSQSKAYTNRRRPSRRISLPDLGQRQSTSRQRQLLARGHLKGACTNSDDKFTAHNPWNNNTAWTDSGNCSRDVTRGRLGERVETGTASTFRGSSGLTPDITVNQPCRGASCVKRRLRSAELLMDRCDGTRRSVCLVVCVGETVKLRNRGWVWAFLGLSWAAL